MPGNDLYTYRLISHREGNIEAVVSVNPESHVYTGHFPGFAITPGVMQVQMIQEILEGALGRELRLAGARNIKFTAMHEPVKARDIHAYISYQQTTGRILAEASLQSGETIYLKFKGEFIGRER
jgi:3-hydroxyacyl-[acyl-carrier-protein] dehydratase